MSLVLRRNEGESPLDAALRAARPYGLEDEVREEYERQIAAGQTEAHAAWCAAYESDVLDVEPDMRLPGLEEP